LHQPSVTEPASGGPPLELLEPELVELDAPPVEVAATELAVPVVAVKLAEELDVTEVEDVAGNPEDEADVVDVPVVPPELAAVPPLDPALLATLPADCAPVLEAIVPLDAVEPPAPADCVELVPLRRQIPETHARPAQQLGAESQRVSAEAHVPVLDPPGGGVEHAIKHAAAPSTLNRVIADASYYAGSAAEGGLRCRANALEARSGQDVTGGKRPSGAPRNWRLIGGVGFSADPRSLWLPQGRRFRHPAWRRRCPSCQVRWAVCCVIDQDLTCQGVCSTGRGLRESHQNVTAQFPVAWEIHSRYSSTSVIPALGWVKI
jgi:hypothetical protein